MSAGSQATVPQLVLMNRVVNPFMRMILMSPLHAVASSRVALITVTGRRSGRVFTLPVGYRQLGDTVTISVGVPERKQWWRNVRGGGPVELRLRGEEHAGWAKATGNQDSEVVVTVDLGAE